MRLFFASAFFSLTIIGAFASALLLASPAEAEDRKATPPALEKILADRVHGKADAPVTMIEYASLTCSHCADFATKVLPALEKKYVESGQLKIIYRDFPLDGTALRAAALARCLPPERYFAFIKLLFQRQSSWAFANDPQQELVRLAALAGLSPDLANACMTDMKIMDALTKARSEAAEKHNIKSTPTFILNDKTVLAGNKPVAEFMAAIDALLPAAAKPQDQKPAEKPASAPSKN